MMINGTQKSILRVFTGSHKCVLYDEETKIKFAENLRLQKLIMTRYPF